MSKATRYSAEVRKRAARFAQEHAAEYRSRWTANRSIAEKIGCTRDTLRRRVRQAERAAKVRPGISAEAGLEVSVSSRGDA